MLGTREHPGTTTFVATSGGLNWGTARLAASPAMLFVLRCSIFPRWSLLSRGLMPTPLRRELFCLRWTPAAWLVGNRVMVVRKNLVYNRPGRLDRVLPCEKPRVPGHSVTEEPLISRVVAGLVVGQI